MESPADNQPADITAEEFFRSLPESDQRRLREFFSMTFVDGAPSSNVIEFGIIRSAAA